MVYVIKQEIGFAAPGQISFNESFSNEGLNDHHSPAEMMKPGGVWALVLGPYQLIEN